MKQFLFFRAPRVVCTAGVLLLCSLALVHFIARAPQQVDSAKVSLPKSPATAVPANLQEPFRHGAWSASTALPGTAAVSQPNSAASARLLRSYGQLPLSFEPNQGQTDKRVKFLSHGKGYTLFLTAREAVLALRGVEKKESGPVEEGQIGLDARRSAVLRMQLVGGQRGVSVVGAQERPGKSNYFIGNDPSKWRTDVPNYGQVRYEGVYPGVDLVYYGRQGELETDFVVGAESDPKKIRLRMSGAEGMRINEEGDLELEVDGEQVVLKKPAA